MALQIWQSHEQNVCQRQILQQIIATLKLALRVIKSKRRLMFLTLLRNLLMPDLSR